MTKKKILSITCFNVFQGGEVRLLNILNILSKSFQIHLLAPGGILTEKIKGKIPVTISKGVGQLSRKSNKFWLFTLLWRFIVSFVEVFYLIIHLKPGIVHCSSETAAFYVVLPAKILKKKIVCELCNVIERNIFWERLSLLIGMFVYRYIVASEAVKDRMIEIGHNPGKIVVMYGGTDTENAFNPEKVPSGLFRKEFGLSPRDILIGTIGVMYPLKGQHLFLEAVSTLNQDGQLAEGVKFLIIGGPRAEADKNYLEGLKNYVSQNGLSENVLITGNIPYALVPYALKDLNVFVFCSILPDAFPRTVVEAMAMEKVVIVSNIGGIPEQIEDGVSGILYEPGNVQELVRNIKYVLDNYPKAEEVALRAKEVAAKRFSNDVFKKKVLTFYNGIFNGETSLKNA